MPASSSSALTIFAPQISVHPYLYLLLFRRMAGVIPVLIADHIFKTITITGYSLVRIPAALSIPLHLGGTTFCVTTKHHGLPPVIVNSCRRRIKQFRQRTRRAISSTQSDQRRNSCHSPIG